MRIILALAALLVACAYAQVDDSTSVNVARCGERETIPREHDKIVGGVEAELGDWKWMAILKKSGSFFCGSSLINVGWLVTAAHCTSGQNAALITTEIGLHDRSNPEEWVLVRNIAKIVNHESYGSILMRNDVAVLKLSSPVTYSFYIGPVCLSTPGDDFIHTYAFATGWGTLSSGGQTSQVLREVQLLVRNETDCSKEGGSLVNNDMMICAGLMNDNMDTCQGDSGGPLVVPNPKNGNKWTLIGITSWGQGCGNVGVYCHVQKYFDWIARAVASN